MEKKDVSNNIRIVNLSGYETPSVKEEHNKDYMLWGDDNDYFDKIKERYLGSATNARCINGLISMIYGRGLDATNSHERSVDYVRMKKLLRPNEVKKTVHDYKLLGMAAIKVVYNKAKTQIIKVSHFPMETLRAEKCDKNGVIKGWYYHPCWAKKKTSEKPRRYPAFKCGSKGNQEEMLIIKPYRSGFYYYSPVDYHSCLQYAQLEEEVSNYHINNIQQGLQPSLLINFNNGVPVEETQELLEAKIYDKFSGSSNAGKFILAFNESQDTKADLEPLHLPDAHAQYQFMSDEAREKIMLGHGIVSPILMGIKDNTGFGNNAEELRTSSVLMDNTLVRPFQDDVINALQDILHFNGIYLNLYFITLQPIEFTEMDNISTKVRKEEETGEKLSTVSSEDFTEEEGEDMISQLEGLGEEITKDWELIHSEKLEADQEAISNVDLAEANPYKSSVEDNGVYKVRYAYMPVRSNPKSRDFCKKMEKFTSNNIVFRKEDINMMSFRGVNKKLGHKGRNYSLLKYKGGKNCHHYWEMRVYKKIGGRQVTPKGDFVKPNNPKEMGERMIDRPNKGAY